MKKEKLQFAGIDLLGTVRTVLVMFGRANKRWGSIGRSKAAFWQDH